MIKQRNITLIVVHCTASRCTSNLTPEDLDSMHKRQGFAECGYHYYITKDGTIHHMRDITHVGAHAKGYNTPSIGVAYEGGLDASGRAVDTRTDALIRQGFREFIPETTKIIIAQRVASVQDADRIIVMEGGRISDIGTHDELLNRNEIYREIYTTQNKAGDQNGEE